MFSKFNSHLAILITLELISTVVSTFQHFASSGSGNCLKTCLGTPLTQIIMNLKERLMQNEIQHLGQIIQTLSYELVVLQDFLKDEYGSKYETFRDKYSSENEPLPCAGSSSGLYSRVTDMKRVDDDLEHVSQPRQKSPTSISVSSAEDYNIVEEISDNEIKYGADTEADMLKDPLDTTKLESEFKGGRKKTKIWKYFDAVRLQNNSSLSARCHMCRSLVSGRASRMVEHRIKCKRLGSKKLSGKTELKRNSVREGGEGLKTVRKVEPDSQECEMDDNEVLVKVNSDVIDVNSPVNRKSAATGRHLDAIWAYFELETVKNLRKAKCLSCGQFISPKAGRMRQHKSLCNGSDQRTAGKRNPEDDINSD